MKRSHTEEFEDLSNRDDSSDPEASFETPVQAKTFGKWPIF